MVSEREPSGVLVQGGMMTALHQRYLHLEERLAAVTLQRERPRTMGAPKSGAITALQ